MSETFGVAAHAVRDLALRDAKDLAIFHAARQAGAVILSKDSDVVLLLERFSPPPQIPVGDVWQYLKRTAARRLV
jgi:predicted nuclease of predicted toxin-antitoxin system